MDDHDRLSCWRSVCLDFVCNLNLCFRIAPPAFRLTMNAQGWTPATRGAAMTSRVSTVCDALARKLNVDDSC
eukprot:4637333-Heterocapsa_arctica.AAC.1